MIPLPPVAAQKIQKLLGKVNGLGLEAQTAGNVVSRILMCTKGIDTADVLKIERSLPRVIRMIQNLSMVDEYELGWSVLNTRAEEMDRAIRSIRDALHEEDASRLSGEGG